MPTIPPRTIGACLTLLGALLATSAFGQYQDTSSESARGFSNNRVQANISDQGSGYSPIGPYGNYYSRPNAASQGRSANWRQQGPVDGLPNSGLALPSDEFLLNWYLLRGPRRPAADLGVTWTPDDERLVVADLTVDGELERVGLQVGDEIARVDRQSVHRRSDWQRIVDSLPAGKEVVIIVHRKGDVKALFWTPSAAGRAEPRAPETQTPADEAKSQQTQAPAGEAKSQQTQASAGQAKSQPIKFITAARFRRGPDGRAWLGMVLDNQIADRATVASVERDSAADQAGLQPKDVILSLSGRDISSPGELMRMIAGIAPGSTVQLFVERPTVGTAQTAPSAVDPGAAAPKEEIPAGNSAPALDSPQ